MMRKIYVITEKFRLNGIEINLICSKKLESIFFFTMYIFTIFLKTFFGMDFKNFTQIKMHVLICILTKLLEYSCACAAKCGSP